MVIEVIPILMTKSASCSRNATIILTAYKIIQIKGLKKCTNNSTLTSEPFLKL